MRIKSNFKLRNIAGENLVVQVNNSELDMTKVISLNSSSVWLWTKLVDRDFCSEDLVQMLVDHYDIDEQTAQRDVNKWIEILAQNGVIE